MTTRLLALGTILDGFRISKPAIKFAAQPVFQIDSHSCWQAVCSDCPPFKAQAVTERNESQSILQQVCHPTALSAIRAAILPRKTLILSRAGMCIGLTPRNASRILNGMDYSSISSLQP